MINGDLWMVIPTANRLQYLDDLIKNSLIPKKNIVLIRTAPGHVIDDVNNIFVKYGNINIHKWWNQGIDFAEKNGAKVVAVLNDDVFIAPGSLQKIAKEVLEQDVPLGFPHPHSGRLAGYCWILNLKYKIRPDNKFKWWYGDNDLQMQAQEISRYIYVSADVRHLEGGKLTDMSKKLKKLTERDGAYFEKKWGERQSFFARLIVLPLHVLNLLKQVLKKSGTIMRLYQKLKTSKSS